MATKIYKAATGVSINVVLPSKKSLHISFTGQSDGSSVYITRDETLQNAMERHYRFGSLFRLVSVKTDEQLQKERQEKEEKQRTEEGTKRGPLRIKVSDYGAAKDYLADNLGISRTAMRSQKQITELAAAHGIKFEMPQ